MDTLEEFVGVEPQCQKKAHPSFGPGDRFLVWKRLKTHYEQKKLKIQNQNDLTDTTPMVTFPGSFHEDPEETPDIFGVEIFDLNTE